MSIDCVLLLHPLLVSWCVWQSVTDLSVKISNVSSKYLHKISWTARLHSVKTLWRQHEIRRSILFFYFPSRSSDSLFSVRLYFVFLFCSSALFRLDVSFGRILWTHPSDVSFESITLRIIQEVVWLALSLKAQTGSTDLGTDGQSPSMRDLQPARRAERIIIKMSWNAL